jgi:Fe2+ transport system protein FeoA
VLAETTSSRDDNGNDDHQVVPLCVLRSGSRCRVRCRHMTEEDAELLAAMGLGNECTVRVCQAGDPCIVQVAATRLGLSRAIAQRILVVPLEREGDGAPPAPSRRAAS